MNRKKNNKVDEYPMRQRSFSSTQELHKTLSKASNEEYVKDETSTSLSNSVVGGSVNVCKIRILTVQPQGLVVYTDSLTCTCFSSVLRGLIILILAANMLPVPVRTRLIMSEKPNDGTVMMHYGELEVADCLNAEDHLPSLPNTVSILCLHCFLLSSFIVVPAGEILSLGFIYISGSGGYH